MHRLIWVFEWHTCHFVGLSYSSSIVEFVLAFIKRKLALLWIISKFDVGLNINKGKGLKIYSAECNILLYYTVDKEIHEFLVKIKLLFLRSLEIFISSREINLCRLDTFPTMVANRPVMYNRVQAFGLLWILLSAGAAIHKSQIDACCLYWLQINKQTLSDTVFFLTKPVVFFRSEELTFFVNSFISYGMASPHINDALGFTIRKVSFNPNKDRRSVMNLRSPGPVAGQPISVKVKYRIPFSEPIQRSAGGNHVHFKTK